MTYSHKNNYNKTHIHISPMSKTIDQETILEIFQSMRDVYIPIEIVLIIYQYYQHISRPRPRPWTPPRDSGYLYYIDAPYIDAPYLHSPVEIRFIRAETTKEENIVKQKIEKIYYLLELSFKTKWKSLLNAIFVIPKLLKLTFLKLTLDNFITTQKNLIFVFNVILNIKNTTINHMSG